jgi:hypothetical protein
LAGSSPNTSQCVAAPPRPRPRTRLSHTR